jgi:hypothetical protein
MDMHLKTTLLPMLTCGLTAMTLIWSPEAAWAQVKPMKSAFPLLSHLNLTAQQQLQMQQLRQSARIQLEAILSPEQTQQFANSMFLSCRCCDATLSQSTTTTLKSLSRFTSTNAGNSDT